MSKNVLILMGSPRKKGNTSILCDEFARGAEEAGHKAEKIDVISRKIAGCLDNFRAYLACYETLNEGGYVFGFNAGAPGDVKATDAMQKAFEMGKNI